MSEGVREPTGPETIEREPVEPRRVRRKPIGRVPIDGMADAVRREIVRRGRRTVKAVSRFPVSTLALAGYRTGRFVVRTWLQHRAGTTVSREGIPVPKPSAAVTAQIALDEAVLAVMNNPSRIPDPDDLARVGRELAEARALFADRGWADDPRSYHADPPPLERPGIRRSRWLGLSYEKLTWDSLYRPHPDEPGADRWGGYGANHSAYAWVLRHRGEPRPWIVCIHGFGAGRPFMDLFAFRAAHLHHGLGLNVALPVLPMHGDRGTGGLKGAQEFMGHDLMNVVHGLAQGTWDIRRLLSWIRAQDAPSVGVYGVSLGGYMTALLAGVESRLDCAIAGIPVCDLHGLFEHHAPERLRRRADADPLLGPLSAAALSVVSPLRLDPLVPRDRRFVFAGLVDRMATPRQAHLLWEHWERPRIAWYDGNHVGFMWSRAVETFVCDAVTEAFSLPDAA